MLRCDRKLVAGPTIELRTHTSRSGDASGRFFVSGGCEVFKNSPPFMPLSQTISTGNARSPADLSSRLLGSPLWLSGAVFVPKIGAVRLS